MRASTSELRQTLPESTQCYTSITTSDSIIISSTTERCPHRGCLSQTITVLGKAPAIVSEGRLPRPAYRVLERSLSQSEQPSRMNHAKLKR